VNFPRHWKTARAAALRIILTFQIAAPSGRILAPFQGEFMNRRAVLASFFFAGLSLALSAAMSSPTRQALFGYSAESSHTERQWEEKLRAIPSPDNLRDYMKRLSARPHHVGSPYDKDNAEWIAAKFKEFGLDTHIEQFDVLFPTPRNAPLKLVEGGPKFVAKLQEPALPQDPPQINKPSSSPLTTPTRSTAMSPPSLSTSTMEFPKTTSSSTAWAFP